MCVPLGVPVLLAIVLESGHPQIRIMGGGFLKKTIYKVWEAYRGIPRTGNSGIVLLALGPWLLWGRPDPGSHSKEHRGLCWPQSLKWQQVLPEKSMWTAHVHVYYRPPLALSGNSSPYTFGDSIQEPGGLLFLRGNLEGMEVSRTKNLPSAPTFTVIHP